jgi:hypothetical protein
MGRIHQPLCTKRKVAGAQSLVKNFINLLPNTLTKFAKSIFWICKLKSVAVCQTCSPFAKGCLPKKASHLIYAKKPRVYVGEIKPWSQLKKKHFLHTFFV